MENNLQNPNAALSRPKREIWNIFFILLFLESLFRGNMISAFNSANALFVGYLNGTTLQRGMMIAALPTGALITRLCVGRVVETNGRRKLITIGLSIMILMTAGFLFVTNMNLLILLRFGQGVGLSIAQTSAAVACTDIINRKRLGEGLGYYSLTNFLNQAIMPTVVVGFTARNDYHGLFMIALAALVIGLGCTLFCNYEKKYPHLVAPPSTAVSLANDPTSGYKPDKPLTKVWMIFEKRAIPCTLIAALASLANSTISNYLLLYASDTGIAQAGLFFTLQAVSMFLTRLLTAKMVDKYGSFKVFVPGVLFAAGCFACLLLSARSETFYYIGGPLSGIGTGLIVPAMNAGAVRSCPPARRSIASSTYMLSSDIALGIGGFIGSFLISLRGYSATFVFSLFCYALSFSLAFWFFRIKNKGMKI